ncbi:GNAT family N-acetyltransferase [Streptomyces gardneri]|uniref:GNAT family N-acetyltransferase n=1 Tax=Nocardia sputi TaxID=2943705 RepID=UPI00189322DB|nr:GNAT family N-acetyltransferase [Nocardia sputi]MBF6163662.1 GNAT family N-acetyltransferase [Streptomyces gardneri]MBF6208357.1 GNAT family N-acetyltransferase [Streptomyces gardneri]
MRIEITTDAAEFRSVAGSFLLRDPLRHTVITTSVANHVTGIDAPSEASRFVSVHGEDGSVVGAAMRVAGRDVYLGALPPDGIPAVARALADVVPQSAGVEGIVEDATAFAQHWSGLRGKGFHRSYVTRLHRLGALRIPDVAGAPRRAGDSDVALCRDWSMAMNQESGTQSGLDEAAIRRRVETGRWWLWERDGEPVSLAAHQIPIQGWSRIGPVYTPPDARGHGYASAVTAHVAKLLRAQSLDVCLFADIANATANRIYRSMGFHPTHEFAHYVFD